MRSARPLLLLVAASLLAAGCGDDAKGGGAEAWRAIASAAGKAREEKIAEATRANEGALGTRLDEDRRADAEFAASDAAVQAAVDWLDAYRPGVPDKSLVRVAGRWNRWPRRVRAAALRALARLHDPAAVSLLSGEAWTLDAAEEEHAKAWLALAQALAPAGNEETRGKMREALEAIAVQREREGHAEEAARSRAIAGEVAALDDPARAPTEADVPRLRAALAAEDADGRAAAAAALARIGTKEAKAAVAERLAVERDRFVAHQLRRIAGGDAAVLAAAPRPVAPGVAAAWDAWSQKEEEVIAAGGDDMAARMLALDAEAKAALAKWPKPADLPPADRVAVARFAEAAREGRALRAALASLANSEDEEGRIATTWIAALALEDHDPAGALMFLRRLEKDFEGKGLDARGRAVSADVLAGAIVDEAAATARRAIEGVSPDPAAAERALAAGREARGEASEDEEAGEHYEAARAYVALERAPFPFERLRPFAGEGRCVVVFAEEYQLFEPKLPSVMRRWAKGVDVVLVGILRGKVRRGIRAYDATTAEEKAVFAARAKELGIPVAGTCGAGGDEPLPRWVGGVPAFVFVLDKEGLIVARVSGPSVDPRALDPVVQPMSRDPDATAPPK